MDKDATTSALGTPRVSVVMPVFNGEPYLAEALESVLSQTLEELELVAVDDGSQDGSREILETLACADSRITVVVNEANLGESGARNRGWQRARAQYIAVLDADDIALPDRLRRQADFLDSHPSVGAVGGSAITIDASGRRLTTRRFPTKNRVIRSALLRNNCCLGHSAMMIRRAALEAVGGYRLNSGMDYDLWLRLSDRFELANVPEPMVLHRLHLGQKSSVAIERKTRATFAICCAAHARRALGVDPLAGVEEFTPEVLGRLPIDEAEVRSALGRRLITQAAILADLGHLAEAESLVEEASRSVGPRAAAAFAATTELKRAESLLHKRRPLAVVRHLLLAFKRDPGFALSLMCGWLASRVPWAGIYRWA
jgi:hypothetical protein